MTYFQLQFPPDGFNPSCGKMGRRFRSVRNIDDIYYNSELSITRRECYPYVTYVSTYTSSLIV